jgi:hypothetical protein
MSTPLVLDDTIQTPTLSPTIHELAARRDSLSDPTAVILDLAEKDPATELSASPTLTSVSDNPIRPAPNPSQTTARRDQSRKSHRLSTFLARISSATAEGAVDVLSPSRSFGQLSRRASNRSAGIAAFSRRLRDASANPDTTTVEVLPQTLCNPDPVSQPHTHDPSTPPNPTTPATIQESSGARFNLVDEKRRELARRPSSARSALLPENARKLDTGSGKERKMHQTSSRLLRMTDDDRPFTRVR